MAKGSVGNYLKNVSSSIKYAAIDKFKELAPAPSDFAENNATLFREVRDSVTKMKSSNMKQISRQIDRRSKIFDAADTAIKNVFSDLRTGKFYNKEREMSGDMFGDDSGFDDQESSWMSTDWNLDDDSQYLGGMMDQVGAKTTSAICSTMAQTTNAISENIKASTKLNYTQSVQTYNLLRKGLGSISENMSQMVEFSNTVMRTHVENSQKFYETSTGLQEKQVELLGKIYDTLRDDKKSETRKSSKLTYSSVTSGGVVDFKEYIKLVKQNASNKVSGSPIGMLQGFDTNMLMGMVTQSPLSFIPKAMMNKLVSKNAEKIFEDFNNSFSGLFGSIMMKVNEYAESGSNEIFKNLASTLGIRSSLKTSLSTSNYEKGTIRWNGKANKALTEVIPTYLAKIEAALTGKTARVFDYESGSFVNADKIRENFNDRLDSRAKSAAYDMSSRFKSEANYIQFDTTKDQEQFQKDIDAFFIALFKRGKIFNFNKANIDNEFSQFGVSSKQNFKIIKNMFMNSPKGMQLMINSRIMSERDSYNNMMNDLEAQGNDLSLMIYNNSGLMGEDEEISRARADIVKLENYQKSLKYKSTEKYKKVSQEIDKLKEKVRNSSSYKEDNKPTNNNFLVKYVDKKGHNVFWYLENILVAIKNSDGFGGIGNYVVPDDSMSVTMKKYEEDKANIADVSLAQRNRANRESKNGNHYISAKDAADNSKLTTNMRIRKEAELKSEKEANKWKGYLFSEGKINTEEFKKRMKEASLFDKFKLVSSALTNIVQRPMNAFAQVMDAMDKKMYSLIYGGKIKMDDGKEVDGILGVMSYHIKSTFTGIKEWFDDSFGAIFRGKIGNLKSKIDFKKFFNETTIGQMFKEFGSTMAGVFSTAKQGVSSVVNPLTDKIVGKKVGSLDEIVINGQSLRSYFGSGMSDIEILEQVRKDPRFYDISSADKKMIDRYSGNVSRYNSAIMKTFGNLTSKMKFSSADNETFQKLLAPMFQNLSINDLGKNEKEVIKNLKSGKFGTLEDLFGKLIKDSSGEWVHDKNDANRRITDDKIYNAFMDAMNKSGFASARGTEEYNIGAFLEQDLNTGLNHVGDTLNELYRDANEYNEKFKDQNSTIIDQQSNIVTNVERIVYLLSKIANEEVPGHIKAKMYREEQHKEEIGRANHEFLSRFRGFDSPYYSSIGGNANGARYITKSGITAISKGEMVIPSDKNPYNPDRDKVNRAQEIANEKRIIKEYKSRKTPYMYNRGTTTDLTQADIDLIAGQFQIPEFDTKYTNFTRLDSGESEDRAYTATDVSNGRQVLFIVNSDNAEMKPYKSEGVNRAAETLSNSLNRAVESLTGYTANDRAKDTKLQKAIEDTIKNAGKYGPRMLAGGLTGAFATGALTGGLISPVLGAAIGAGTALLSASDKFKEWMFGINEDGEFKGGILPPKVVNWFAKHGKNLGLTSIGGAIIGGIKGHPLIGLTVGAGLGLLNSSEKFKDYMFGDEGLINPKRREKISKLIKSTLIGTVGASFIAPGIMSTLGSTSLGILPQLLLGAGVGMLATSNKFQEMIFGRKDDATGKYEHGLIPAIRHIVVDPLGKLMHGFGERVKSFVKVSITRPLQTFFEPLSRLKKKTGEFIKGFFTNIGDHVGRSISGGFKAAFTPIFDAIKNSKLAQGIKNVLGTTFKTVGTLINPFKWMEAGGKGLGNLLGRMGLMNHLTTEEYENRYGFNIFGKQRALKRKNQATISAIENPENQLSGEDYKSILGNLRLINTAKHDRIKNQKEAASKLKNKLLDSFGHSYVDFDTARNFATKTDFSRDENGNLNEDAQRQLDDLTLAAYRQRMVGQNIKAAKKDKKSSGDLLWDMVANYNSKEKADLAIKIIDSTMDPNNAIKKMEAKRIKIPASKMTKFIEEFNRYKRFSGIAAGQSVKEWDNLGKNEDGSIDPKKQRELQLKAMRSNKAFDNEAVASGILSASQEYRTASLAVTNAEDLFKETNLKLKDLGINPDGLNSRQLEEILRGQYNNLRKQGLLSFFDEDSEENKDETEATEETSEAVSEISNNTSEMIDLLRRIADKLDPSGRSITSDSGDNNQSESGEASESTSGRRRGFKVRPRRRNSIEERVHEASTSPAETSEAEAEEEEQTDDRIFHDTEEPSDGAVEAPKPTIWQRVKGFFTKPLGFANGTYGPLPNNTLAAVSAGELIVDGSASGYNNRLSSNRIWNLANGTDLPKSDGDTADSSMKNPKTEDPKKMSLFQKMSFNMEKMRQSFMPDKELKSSKGGKGPTFFQKMGAGLKGLFDPKKLFKKTGLLMVGAGLLLAPLLDKVLKAVVPFLTEKVIPAIVDALPGIINSLKDLLPSIMDMITTTIPKFIKVLAQDLLPALLELLPALISGTGEALAGIVEALPAILKPLLDCFPAVINAILKDLLPSLHNMMPEFIAVLADSLGDITESLMAGLVSIIGSIIKNLPSIVANLLKGVGNTIVGLFKGLFSWGSGSGKKKSKIHTAIDTNVSLPTEFIENMNAAGKGKQKKNIFNMAGSGIISFFKNLFKSKKDVTSKTSTEKPESIENTITTYTNGVSYLNGKQVNPVLAHISQNADKYKNRSFNLPNIDKGITLGTDGCGVMSGAMVINGLLGEDAISPEKVADAALRSGNKAAGGGVKTKFFKEYFKKFGIDTEYHNMTNKNDKNKATKNIIEALKANKPVILMGNDTSNSGKTPFPDNNHYVVATGISEDGSKIILNDPYNTVGGDVYNLNDVLDKTIVGIAASKNRTGLTTSSVDYTKKTETNNTYSAAKLVNVHSIQPIATNTATTNLGKEFDPIAYQDLGEYNPMTVEEMDNFINYWASINGHTEFVGHGDIFIKAAEETGLDPRYILAHAATESNWGTSRLAKDKGNYFGITAYNDSPYASATTFSPGMQGIIDGAAWIRKNYYDAGQKSLYGMIYGNPSHRYAVYNDGSPNSQWISTISSIMRKGPNAYTNINDISGSGEDSISGVYSLNEYANNTNFQLNEYDTRENDYQEYQTYANEAYSAIERSSLNVSENIKNGKVDSSIINSDAIKTLNNAYNQLYDSNYAGVYSSIEPKGSSIHQAFTTSMGDLKHRIMRLMYNQVNHFNINAIKGNTNLASSDPKGFDLDTQRYSTYNTYPQRRASDMALLIENAYRNTLETDNTNLDALSSTVTDINADISRVLQYAHQSSSEQENRYRIIPIVPDVLSLDNIVMESDGQTFNEKYGNTDYTDIIMREFLYNPAIFYNDNKRNEMILGLTNKGGDRQKLTMFAEELRDYGVSLTPEQTEALYKSPTVTRLANTIQLSTFGSLKSMGNLSPMRTFQSIIRPDSSTFRKLDEEDTNMHAINMTKLYDGIITTNEYNDPVSYSKEKASDLKNLLLMGNVGSQSGLNSSSKETALNDDKFYDIIQNYNTLNPSIGDDIEVYNELAQSKPTDTITRTELSVSDTGKSSSIIDIIRNIGSAFSNIFEKIGEMLFGVGGEISSGQMYGNPWQHADTSEVDISQYSYSVDNENGIALKLIHHPKTYATEVARKNSIVLRELNNPAYDQQFTMNGYYSISVYAKVPDADTTTPEYFLADGYTIRVPNTEILNLDVLELIPEATFVGGTENVSDADGVDLTVNDNPYKFGNPYESEVLKKYITAMPNAEGLYSLRVFGKDNDGNYVLSDGSTVSIPDASIVNSEVLSTIPTHGITGVGQSINDIIGNIESNVADNFFINQFKNGGAYSAKKTSNGPPRDTMNADRRHSGIDYGTGGRNPAIYSPISGTVHVMRSADSGNAAGNYIAIKEDGTDSSPRYHRFMHMLDKPNFKQNERIEQGQFIGYVGNTGQSSGTHLHYDIADTQGLNGASTMSSDSEVSKHFEDPNAYLRNYFKKQGYTGTKNAIYNQDSGSSFSSSSSSDTSAAKGGEYRDIGDIYELILKVVEYLAKITDNTGLIGEIVTLLTQLDEINSNPSLSNQQKMEKSIQVRKSLASKAKEYSQTLNSVNNQTTGHQAMVQSMQYIASR